VEHTLTIQLVVILAVGTALVAMFQHFGLSPILGYLATGVLVGPSVLDWLPDEPATHLLAEVGVILLMFTIGLEFSLPRLLAAKRLVLGLGGAQVALTTALFGLLAGWWGLQVTESFVVGSALAMSSTAIVFKQLGEQMELSAPHGRIATGILLFQDIATVPLLAILPILAAEPTQLAGELSLAVGKAILVFIILVYLGRRVLPPALHWVAAKRSLELFMLTALLVALSASAVSSLAGLSSTLGAFMAGMLLGETLFRHQVEADIRPFRDLMLGLFFTTIGMQLDPAIFVQAPTLVALILTALIVGKLFILGPLIRVFGYPTMESWRSAIILAQGGEFGLLLVASALTMGVLEPSRAQPLLGAIIVSMAFAPLMLRFNDRLATLLATGRSSSGSHDTEVIIAEASSDFDGHVIVCGYGRLGQNLVSLLAQESIPVLALDLDPDRIRQAAAAGEPVLFGNILQPGILRAAGIDRASVLAITFENASLVGRIVNHVRYLHGDIPVLVRSTRGRDDDALVQAGATIFPEGLETSIAFAGQLMIMLGISQSRVEARINMIRAENYAPLQTFFHDSAELATGADAQDYPLQMRAVIVVEGQYASGRTPQELGLAELGVELVDVRRGAIQVPGCLLDTRLRPGDVLLIKGHREMLDNAIARLMEGS
jgi:K+:H+ antiporter